MIRVLVLGQTYWADRIAQALDAPEDGISGVFVSPGGYAGLLMRPPRADRVIIMRAGYRAGATTPRGRLFDTYWSLLRRSIPKALACHYWLGTDVLNTLEEVRAGTLGRGVIGSIRDDLHLADAPWLAAELGTVGIQAITAHVPVPHRAPAVPPPLPADFSVLTYLPENRFDFYGGNTILEAARRLGDVRFDVVGCVDDPARQAPPNIRWHGWVANMPSYYADATVVVRIPRHDGLGETVIEGLLNARHVLYTQEIPCVRRIWPPTPEALVAEVAALRDAHVAGRLEPNLAGRAYALVEFDEVRLAHHLAEVLRSRA
jgi:hypothetical protein